MIFYEFQFDFWVHVKAEGCNIFDLDKCWNTILFPKIGVDTAVKNLPQVSRNAKGYLHSELPKIIFHFPSSSPSRLAAILIGLERCFHGFLQIFSPAVFSSNSLLVRFSILRSSSCFEVQDLARIVVLQNLGIEKIQEWNFAARSRLYPKQMFAIKYAFCHCF